MNRKQHLLAALITTLAVLGTAQSAIAQTSGQAQPLQGVSPDVYEVVSAFYAYDQDTPFHAHVLATRDAEHYTREKILFTGINPVRVPAYLAIPKTGDGPFPVVLLLDGIDGSKERWFEEDSWPRGNMVTDALTSAGIAVMSLDARYHGERVAETGYVSPSRGGAAFRDLFVPTVIEYRRAIDYLGTRPEIDTTRIGALGLSMGGMMTFALAALDGRLDAAVAGVTPVGAFNGADRIPYAPQTFAGYVPDIPILTMWGRSDNLYSEASVEQFMNLLPSTQEESIWYDTGHRLGPEYPPRATSWLIEHLKN
jgi:dienelactone hydrolase